jgi:hypothetical protein
MDSRFQDDESRKRIFNMFLPTIVGLCDYHLFIQSKSDSDKSHPKPGAIEKRLMSICIAFVLRYMDLDLLIKWMAKENAIRCNVFMELLSFMPNSMQYPGKERIHESLQKSRVLGLSQLLRVQKLMKTFLNWLKLEPSQF